MGVLDSVKKALNDANPVGKVTEQLNKPGPKSGPQADYEAKEAAMNKDNPYYKGKEPKDYSNPVQTIRIK